MSEPVVCAVCLVNGRPEMVKRAVASFSAQTYERKSLLIWDSGPDEQSHYYADRHVCAPPLTIGQMRNGSASYALDADIIAHWDSDDWSHPNRLSEQVALLQASGADCVGYHQAVFWRDFQQLSEHDVYGSGSKTEPWDVVGGETWIYTGQVPRLCAIGASLMYWRRTWERVPFDDVMTGEDSRFVARVNTVAVSGLRTQPDFVLEPGSPRIICSIHAGNTVQNALRPGAREWRRAEELDGYCREKMQL